jgi:hypothetical protein
VAWWKSLATDADAQYDKVVVIDAADIAPSVTWGTSPEDVLPITATVPAPESFADPSKQDAARKSLEYMGLEPGTALDSVEIQNVFIGSCTNSRIEDLRAAAAILKGRKKADNVRWAIVVPGSGLVKAMAEDEGLDVIFKDAGLEWREPGCSACLGMNPDKVPAGTLRVHFQPQFRRSPGAGCAHPPGQPGDGRRRCRHRPPDGRARTGLTPSPTRANPPLPRWSTRRPACWSAAACRARPRSRPAAITRTRPTSSGGWSAG